jgi:hypothetical protein
VNCGPPAASPTAKTRRFDARSRQLRLAIAAVLAVAVLVAAFTWRLEWPFEQAVWRFHSGDVAAARELAAAVGEVPQRWQRTWRRLGDEIEAAGQLAPDARDWESARGLFQAQAWQRGEDVLLTAGPAAARPWFALAIDALDLPTALQRAVHAYCAAADAEAPERMWELKRVVQQLGVPAKLAPVFAD